MQGEDRGAGLNGPLVYSREAAATSLGPVFSSPERLGDPENTLRGRGRKCSLQLSPAQLMTVGAQQGGPQDPCPCPKSGCRHRETRMPTGQPQPRDRRLWLQAAATPAYSHILYISCIPWILYIPLQLLHPVALS